MASKRRAFGWRKSTAGRGLSAAPAASSPPTRGLPASRCSRPPGWRRSRLRHRGDAERTIGIYILGRGGGFRHGRGVAQGCGSKGSEAPAQAARDSGLERRVHAARPELAMGVWPAGRQPDAAGEKRRVCGPRQPTSLDVGHIRGSEDAALARHDKPPLQHLRCGQHRRRRSGTGVIRAAAAGARAHTRSAAVAGRGQEEPPVQCDQTTLARWQWLGTVRTGEQAARARSHGAAPFENGTQLDKATESRQQQVWRAGRGGSQGHTSWPAGDSMICLVLARSTLKVCRRQPAAEGSVGSVLRHPPGPSLRQMGTSPQTPGNPRLQVPGSLLRSPPPT